MASLNPITCKACNAQFSVPDDLFKRRLSGRKVIVRCRTCGAHITVDATDSAPPSQGESSANLASPLPPASRTPSESLMPESSPSASLTPASSSQENAAPVSSSQEGTAPASSSSPERSTSSSSSSETAVPAAKTANEPRPNDSPLRIGVQPLPTRAAASPGVVPRLSGHKAKLPPVVPRAFAAPPSVRPRVKASEESTAIGNTVVVTAAKSASVSRVIPKNEPPRLAPGTAAAPERGRLASAPESTASSSTRLIAAVPRPAPPPARQQAAKFEPAIPKVENKPIATADDADRPTVPVFDSDEAPTHPLGAELSGPVPTATAAAALSSEAAPVQAAAAVSEQETSVEEARPSSALDSAEREVLAAVDVEVSESEETSAESVPTPLGHAMASGGVMGAPAGTPKAPSQPARPSARGHRARWVVAVGAPVVVAASVAVFVGSSKLDWPGIGILARDHDSKRLLSPEAARETQQHRAQATAVPSEAAEPVSVATATSTPAKAEPDAKSEPAPQPTGDGAREAAVDIPEGANRDLVMQRVTAVLARAERCHLGGRVTGTAAVVLTFEGNGRVSQARVEGEPIASAPVATCILTHARSILIPKFSGPSFTLRRPITLR